MNFERSSKKTYGERVLLEDGLMTSEDTNALTVEDIEELKKFLDDLLEMHTEGYSLVSVFVSASFNESGWHARQRYYEAQRQGILKERKEVKKTPDEDITNFLTKRKKEEEDEPI